MKFLFIIQGEGRGHLTQAISLAEMLRRQGHEVNRVLVGASKQRVLPSFFLEKIEAKVDRYASPNFAMSLNNKRVSLSRTIFENVSPFRFKRFFESMQTIKDLIDEEQPDVIVNFYELLAGLLSLLHKIDIPVVSVANQNMLLHPDHVAGYSTEWDKFVFRINTVLCNVSSTKLLALSFKPARPVPRNHLYVVPPLVRSEVLHLQTSDQGFVLGYMLNSGFADEVRAWHKRNPTVSIHIFWDKKDAPEELVIDENLVFHRLNDQKFLEMMKDCRAIVSTAGFGTLSEAMYLQKPIMMIPVHVEQEMNAAEVAEMGYGIVSKKFDLTRLMEYVEKEHVVNGEFKKWVDRSEELMVKHLTTFA